MPIKRGAITGVVATTGRFIKNMLKIRGVFAFFLIVFSFGMIWLASIYSSQKYTITNLTSGTPPGLDRIDDRRLDAIVAFKDRNGAIVVREFGKLKNDGVAPEETLVDLGSITKTVTAVATLKLVDNARLGLSETLDAIWPDVPDDKADITVHQLLTHTSGLTNEVGQDHDRLSRESFVDRVFESDLDEDHVGEYHYSNAGYGLLAAIVERRSGKSFDAFLNEDLLRPAGLDPIGYEQAYTDDRSLLTTRSHRTLFSRQSIWTASWGGHSPGWSLIGNGGMVSTPVSLLRFWSAVREGRIISTGLLRKALTPHTDSRRDEESFYGYGLMIQDMAPHGRVYWHDGENDVFSSEFRELGNSGLIVMTAGRDRDAFEAMRLILRDMGESAGS